MNNNKIKSMMIHGPFSEIDFHFARLITRLSGEEIPEVFLAAALVSHATGEGNACLDLLTAPTDLWDYGCTADTEGQEASHEPIRFEKLLNKLYSSSVVGRPGAYRPLILDDRSRLYLYRYWEYEKILTDKLISRASMEDEQIDAILFKDSLSRLFPETEEGETDRQKVAAFISVTKKFCVISGGPGTGKSTLIAKILSLILEQDKAHEMRIAFAAPTGKATARLLEAIKKGNEMLPKKNRVKENIISKTSTIHRLMGTIPDSPYFRHNAENQLPVDILVIDESSMVDLALMSKLVQAVPPHAGIILLGDKDQLASVEAGAAFGDICGIGHVHGFSKKFSNRFEKITGGIIHLKNREKIHIAGMEFQETKSVPKIQDCIVQLQKNYRFGADSGISALSRAVKIGDGKLAMRLLRDEKYDDIRWHTLPKPDLLRSALSRMIIKGYRPYLESEDQTLKIFNFFDQFRILCALRRGPYGVSEINILARRILMERNLIIPNKSWYRGRPLLITKNDYNLGLFNGDIGIILPDPDSNHELRAFFPSSNRVGLRKFSPIRLPEHESVYTMTVHKSQGSEFDKVLLLLPDRDIPLLTRELIYTGITRAKKNIEIWSTEKIFIEAVKRRTRKESGLCNALWGA